MTKSSPDSPTRSPAQPIDGAASNADGASEPEIHVRFRYEMWHVEGASPEYDLLFDDLVEAEQYAVQVARHSAAEVVVHGEDDAIIARRQHDHLD